MRITRVNVLQLQVPLKKTYALSKAYGKLEITEPIIVEVHTDEGIVGYGECEPWPLFTGESVGTTLTVLKELIIPAMIGADPCNIWNIHHKMDRVIKGKQRAKGAIDIACYDILGKANNLPVHTILGGKQRDKMPVMWSIGGSTPEESVAEVLAARDAGYQGCMIKVGSNDYKLDAARTVAVREAVGPDFALNVDANQGWDTDTAIRFGRLVEKCDLMYLVLKSAKMAVSCQQEKLSIWRRPMVSKSFLTPRLKKVSLRRLVCKWGLQQVILLLWVMHISPPNVWKRISVLMKIKSMWQKARFLFWTNPVLVLS